MSLFRNSRQGMMRGFKKAVIANSTLGTLDCRDDYPGTGTSLTIHSSLFAFSHSHLVNVPHAQDGGMGWGASAWW